MTVSNKFARLSRLAITMFLALALMAGCWDYHEVHQVSYGSALGVDYKDSKYNLYILILDFTHITKLGGRPSKIKSVVGSAQGNTFAEAMFELYRSEQQFIYWGHIKTAIFTRQALEKIKPEHLVDIVNRFRELRYNVWLFGTDEPIDKLMNSSPIFGYSPYDTQLMKPEQSFRQFSNIQPIYLNRFVSRTFDRGQTVLLPKLGLDSSSWTEGGDKRSELYLKGVYLFSSNQYLGSLTEEQIKGGLFMDSKMERLPVTIYRNGKAAALLVTRSPRIRISHTMENGHVRFNVRIRLTGYADEFLQSVTPSYLKEQAQTLIEQEVRSTFDNGKKINADVLNLTAELYKNHYPTWKRLFSDRMNMEQVELGSVKVDFTLLYLGSYKESQRSR